VPVVLDPTIGGVNANTYCTLLEANAYHDAHEYESVWTAAASDDRRNRALVHATRLLDQHVDWDGTPATFTQRLCWPRWGLTDRVGDNIGMNEIPEDLKFATAELARQLLAKDVTADSDIETQGITGVSVGPVSLQFGGKYGMPPAPRVVPDAVYYMVQQWGRLRSRAGDIAADLERA
jgi:hypothetical protein